MNVSDRDTQAGRHAGRQAGRPLEIHEMRCDAMRCDAMRWDGMGWDGMGDLRLYVPKWYEHAMQYAGCGTGEETRDLLAGSRQATGKREGRSKERK
jgi:hypothetical protein